MAVYRRVTSRDEAMHPLTLLTFGLYGEVLPKQNGAPVRLVVPWKYGFKSAKLIGASLPKRNRRTAGPYRHRMNTGSPTSIRLSTTRVGARRRRVRIGEGGGLFAPKRKTLMFNGYAEQVASLYARMDLKKFF